MKARYFLILLLACACREEKDNSGTSHTINAVHDHRLFEAVSETHTNISFNNKVVETNHMNALNYDYMYNGSGVSVGDFNLDGLPDIYFAANHLPNRLYLNKGNLAFEDITEVSKTGGRKGFDTGTTVVDINSDGLPDIYVCKSGRFENPDQRRNELFVNQGNDMNGIPVFREEAAKYKLDLPHYSTQASFFDYDRDGDLDVFLINHNIDSDIHYSLDKHARKKVPEASDRLFENRNNTFVDISDQAGIINDGIGFGLGLTIGDLNNDTWPDIVIGQDFASKDRIYLNQQNGTFTEVIDLATRHISNFSMGNDIADINNDGWLDFMSLDMVSEDNYGMKASMSGMNPENFAEMLRKGYHYQYMYNTVQINNGLADSSGIPYFSDVAGMAGVTSTDWSWGPLFFDMDLDGDKDLFISNGILRDFRNVDYIHYRERAEHEFVSRVKDASPALKTVVQQQHDANLIRRMPPRKKANYFYENKGDLSFQKRNNSWVQNSVSASNGACYADLDRDGDLDLITNNMEGLAGIYRNNSRELGLGNYIQIQLTGSEKNKDGVGARVRIQTKEGIQIAEQYVSRGFQSSVEKILHFGLGKEKQIQELSVIWPDGKVQLLTSVDANQMLKLRYADATHIPRPEIDRSHIFRTVSPQTYLSHSSTESIFNDFERESLLPHMMSREGPALATGDFNSDGLSDFYIGGAKGYVGTLYLQDVSGKFKPQLQKAFQTDRACEDVDATFFDADLDGDLDLYVVSGSNEYEEGSAFYIDRLYINENGNFRKAANAFDKDFAISGSVVKPCDYDKDGDIDLFIGGRQRPAKYPFPASSVIVRNDSKNGKIRFSTLNIPFLRELGMVTDATWQDVDGDDWQDLIIVGEWMPVKIFKNKDGSFTDLSQSAGLDKQTGWWFSIDAGDFDQDGDIDLIAGNLGLNSKYQTSPNEPFQIFTKDFDQTGSLDIVLSYHQQGEHFPLRGRECSSNQMPFLKKKFPSYHTFALANMEEVYGRENLESALHYRAHTFESSYFENMGNGRFIRKPLPRLAQTTIVREIIVRDLNADQHPDLLLFGNMYGFEVETPRQDAGYGLFLAGKGDGTFSPQMPYESGLYALGEVAQAAILSLANGKQAILLAKNNDSIQWVEINSNEGE